MCGKRVVKFTSGQGIVYGVEQCCHAPGKCSTMVLEVVARALTKHAPNVHCEHDEVLGRTPHWMDHLVRQRRAASRRLGTHFAVDRTEPDPRHDRSGRFSHFSPGTNFLQHESELIREFLGSPDDIIDRPITITEREPISRCAGVCIG